MSFLKKLFIIRYAILENRVVSISGICIHYAIFENRVLWLSAILSIMLHVIFEAGGFAIGRLGILTF